MSQYFDNDLEKSCEKIIEEMIENKKFKFKTDLGVFSKDHVDEYTKFLLSTIVKNESEINSVLDVGCGYGVIGIFFSNHFSISAEMIDINNRALALSNFNCKLNNVQCSVYESFCFEKVENSFDLIVTNPPIHAGKEICYKIYSSAKDHLTVDGSFYIVIAKKHGYKSTLSFLKKIYSYVEIADKNKSVYVLKCKI